MVSVMSPAWTAASPTGGPLTPTYTTSRLDRSTWVADIQLNDGSKLATSPVNSSAPMTWASGDHPIPAYDVNAANAELQAAGWRDDNKTPGIQTRTKRVRGVNLSLKLQFSGFAGQQVNVLTKMKQNLAAVGVELDVVTDTPQDMNGRYANRNFDGIMFSNCQGTDPEVGMTLVYKTSSISTAAFTNGAGYKNPAVDKAFADGAAQLTLAARAPFYAQAAARIQSDLPTLWIFETVSNKGHRARCTGFKHCTGLYAEAAICRR